MGMGSQRWLAEQLMEHFLITEDRAYELTSLVEELALAFGDDLADAVYPLEESGDLATALANLEAVRTRLDNAITQLREAFTPLGKRRNPDGTAPGPVTRADAHNIAVIRTLADAGFSPDDVVLLNIIANKRFGPWATVVLPSGKQVTGTEIRHWIDVLNGREQGDDEG